MKLSQIGGIILASAMLFGAPAASAQSLGGLLKKAGKVVEKVDKTLNGEQAKAKTTTITSDTKNTPQAVTLNSGATMVNELENVLDIEFLGLYGTPVNENYGNCWIALKVTPKINVSKIDIGSMNGEKMMAIGKSGKLYTKYSSGSQKCDVMEGIPVIIKIDAKDHQFQDVKLSEETMAQVKFMVYTYGDINRGAVTLKNVPILWNQTLEE